MPDQDVTAPKQRVPGRPFQQGKSGNPKGRPKRTSEILTRKAVLERLWKVAQYPTKNSSTTISACKVLLEAMPAKAEDLAVQKLPWLAEGDQAAE